MYVAHGKRTNFKNIAHLSAVCNIHCVGGSVLLISNQFHMKNTYFIIFYVGQNSQGTVYGHAAFEYKSKFPNRLETEKTIIENYGVDKCVINNIIKISKSDYDEWCRK